jgi:hypothetical protein
MPEELHSLINQSLLHSNCYIGELLVSKGLTFLFKNNVTARKKPVKSLLPILEYSKPLLLRYGLYTSSSFEDHCGQLASLPLQG